MSALAGVLGKPGIVHVPVVITEVARSHHTNLQMLMRQAERAVADNSADLPVASMRDVVKMMAEAKKSEAIVNQMMNGVARLSG